MIVRFDNSKNKLTSQDICLIEATSNLGVKVKRWSHINGGVGNFYERVVVRHLSFNRS